jgi:ketosteroid isomerase-like protein
VIGLRGRAGKAGRYVNILRSSFEATQRGDFEATLKDFDPDFELRLPPEFPGAGTGHGHQAWLRAQQQFEEAFRDISYEPKEFVDAGDRVLAAVRFTGHARHTGIPVDLLVYWVYTFRDDRIVAADVFLDRPRALEAVGLSD